MDHDLAEQAARHCKRIVADQHDAARDGASGALASDRARLVASYLHEMGVTPGQADHGVLRPVEAYALERYGPEAGARAFAAVARGFLELFEAVGVMVRDGGAFGVTGRAEVVSNPDFPK